MAAKRVESFRVPCLDAGSTPATSTKKRIAYKEKRMRFLRIISFIACRTDVRRERKILPSADAHSERLKTGFGDECPAELQHLVAMAECRSGTAATLPERSAR